MMPRVPFQVPEGLLFALTAFGPLAFGCVEPWSRAALEILAFLLAFACSLRGRRNLPPLAAWFWLFPASLAAFGALQALSPVAPDLPRPWAPFTAAAHATQSSVLLWAAYAALVWSVPQVITTHAAARRYCRLLFGLGLALAAQGMLQAATGGGKLYWLRPTSILGVFGPYYNRDHAANFLLMTLAVGLGILWSKLRRRPEADGSSSGPLRPVAWLGAGVALVLAGILVCGSRGALLAMPLAGALTGFLGAGFAKSARERRFRMAAALAFAVFAVFFTFKHVGAGAEAGALTDGAITARFFIYGDSWNWLRDSPVFGTGLGSFETVYPSYQDQGLTGHASHAHGDWLELALETGLVGLLGALTAAFLLAAAAARAWLAAESREMRALIGGALCAAAAFAIHSLFEFGFQIPGNAVVFFGIVGFLLSAPIWKDKAAGRVRPAAPSAWLAAGALLCFLGGARAAATSAGEEYPKALRRLASARLRDAAAAGGEPDAGALRTALGLSLAAVELRPFDSTALALAGTALQRLGRASDARAFFERSELVRFTPVGVVSGKRRRGNQERQLATLRELRLVK